MYEHFIKKKHTVQEEDKARTFRSGKSLARKPRNAILCGLEGSGREALARSVAERMGMDVVRPEPTAEALGELSENEWRIALLGPEHLDVADALALIPSLGHVFFLMADVPFLITARSLPEGDDRHALAKSFPDLEMRFHSLGGLPLSAYRPTEENAEQIIEVLGMSA